MTGRRNAVLLDTHVLVWLVEGDERLSMLARAAIDEAGDQVWISAITPWEIGMLASKGRLRLGQEVAQWMDAVLALPGVRLAELSPAIAIASSCLPGAPHGDPADRIIAATARHLDLTLVTADQKLLDQGARGYLRVVAA
ncbi:type II toxin-antitoxin system VapC family toxin [Sphaerotilus montanus]|uniref:type II toxin-antitoxin system VapC family toxin n=1 Tax=Sphaerotilus montanus TaxID=522889 RepID=UPI003FA2497B